MHAVPEPLKSHVRVCSSSFTSSRDIRRAISEYVKSENKENFKKMFENDPMEVDVLVPWQGAKGKGKSKGKAKGKGMHFLNNIRGYKRTALMNSVPYCGPFCNVGNAYPRTIHAVVHAPWHCSSQCFN